MIKQKGSALRKTKKMKHRHSIATVVSFVFLLGALSIAFWLLPDRDFSARENRALQTLPRPSSEKLLSGELANSYNDYSPQ